MSSQKYLVVFDNLEKVARGLSPENWTRPLGRVGFSRPHPPKTIDEVVRCGEGPLTTHCSRSVQNLRVSTKILPLADQGVRRVISYGRYLPR